MRPNNNNNTEHVRHSFDDINESNCELRCIMLVTGRNLSSRMLRDDIHLLYFKCMSTAYTNIFLRDLITVDDSVLFSWMLACEFFQRFNRLITNCLIWTHTAIQDCTSSLCVANNLTTVTKTATTAAAATTTTGISTTTTIFQGCYSPNKRNLTVNVEKNSHNI